MSSVISDGSLSSLNPDAPVNRVVSDKSLVSLRPVAPVNCGISLLPRPPLLPFLVLVTSIVDS